MKDETITINSLYFWSDDTTIEEHDINLNDILGFKIHYRVDNSWHIEVVTKEKLKDGDFYSYELSHTVYVSEVLKLFTDDRCVILAITNMQQIRNFKRQLLRIFKTLNS
jgi:hypothetical protein